MERLVTKGPLSEAWNATFPRRRPRTQQQLALLYGFGAGLTAGGAMMLMAFGFGIAVGILLEGMPL